MAYNSRDSISSRTTRYNYDVGGGMNSPVKNNNNVIIAVKMKGTTPAAHADAILKHFGMSRADEQAFKEKYGYDLRQTLVDSYAKSDQPKAHIAVGGGYYRVNDKIYARTKGWIKNGEPDWKRVENLRVEQNLTWHHHQDGTTMELLPSDLNSKVPHTGGASSSRRSK